MGHPDFPAVAVERSGPCMEYVRGQTEAHDNGCAFVVLLLRDRRG